jgi:hypothetical protein
MASLQAIKRNGSTIDYKFVDSEIAHVWDRSKPKQRPRDSTGKFSIPEYLC